jgi:predicted DNA-binding ribbon-helix-helix protein
MSALIVRMPQEKRERLKQLARARAMSVNKLIDEMATILLAEFDAETRFRVRSARGAGKTRRALALLEKARRRKAG